uniref:Uncharacterized protein n=1 Tax=Cacopsylla melanoneura TaxID=428564 RepID=A0A8D8QCS8_9HEMI
MLPMPKECFSSSNSENTSILNVSSLNDDLIHDLVPLNVSSSNQEGINGGGGWKNVVRGRGRGGKKPKLVSCSSPEITPSVPTASHLSSSPRTSSKVMVYDISLKRKRNKIPSLVPMERQYIPRQAKSNFRMFNRKLGT